MNIAYHLAPEGWYASQPADADYLPEPFEAEGFVHLTRGVEATLAVGNRYYRSDERPYLVLTIDLAAITSETRYQDAERRYPHVHGPLDRAAIIAVRRVVRGADGAFLGVGGSATAEQ